MPLSLLYRAMLVDEGIELFTPCSLFVPHFMFNHLLFLSSFHFNTTMSLAHGSIILFIFLLLPLLLLARQELGVFPQFSKSTFPFLLILSAQLGRGGPVSIWILSAEIR
jgi:hypothetical protein